MALQQPNAHRYNCGRCPNSRNRPNGRQAVPAAWFDRHPSRAQAQSPQPGTSTHRHVGHLTRYTPWGMLLTALGRHLLIELHDCDPKALDDVDLIRDTLVEAAIRLDSTILDVATHKFDPIGVSAFVMIAESHLSIHTWPEHGYAAMDVFTCSSTMQPADVLGFLSARLGSDSVQTVEVNRGILPLVRAGRPG